MSDKPSYVLKWESKGFVVPRWWLWLNPRFPKIANRIYSWRYGQWAPSLMDLIESTPLHEISPSVIAQFREASRG